MYDEAVKLEPDLKLSWARAAELLLMEVKRVL